MTNPGLRRKYVTKFHWIDWAGWWREEKEVKIIFFKEVVGSPAGQADIIGAGRAAENNVFTLPFDGKIFSPSNGNMYVK